MRTCIATVSLSGTLSEKLEAIVAAGFDGVEIFEQDFLANALSPRDIGQQIRDYGLEIMLLQPFRDFEGLPQPLRRRAFDRAERKFDLMQELGTELVLVPSSVSPEALGGVDRAADDFAALGERAAARGLRVGYEALAWGRYVNDHRDAWEVVRRAGHPSVGLVLDSFHTLARQIDPESIRAIPGDRIFWVQMADAPAIPMDLLHLSRHYRTMPGEGELPVVDFMRAVAASGYTRAISLEIFYDRIRGGRAKELARDGNRSLVFLLDEVRRAEPESELGSPDIPPRIDIKQIEFVEFASQADEGDALAQLLGSMGFVRAGAHKSKSIDLWRQGRVRILINGESSGFSRAAYLTSGTSVCDIGFGVPDSSAMIARADAMGAYPFAQPTSPGEFDLPAFRSVGGCVMHFIDETGGFANVWDREFDRADGPEAAGMGELTSIDHLGAVMMSYDELLSWSLFYSCIFNMTVTQIIEVIGLDGVFQSKNLETPGRSFRLSLSSADMHGAAEIQAPHDRSKSSIQHIAFATADIFGSSASMASNGFSPLPISHNYYEDLSARFDLSHNLLYRMEDANVLYARNENSEFFHYYSQPFGRGMFFEVVERKGGYNGYGISNEPFRIGAHRRLLNNQGDAKTM